MTFNFQIWRNAQYNFKKEYDRGISSAKVFPIIPQSLKSRKHTKKSSWVAASELEIPCSPYIILWIWPHHCEGKNGFSLVCFWWYSYLRDLLKKMAKPTQLPRDFQVYMVFFVSFDFCSKSMVKYHENKVVRMASEDSDKHWTWTKLWYSEIGINFYLLTK